MGCCASSEDPSAQQQQHHHNPSSPSHGSGPPGTDAITSYWVVCTDATRSWTAQSLKIYRADDQTTPAFTVEFSEDKGHPNGRLIFRGAFQGNAYVIWGQGVDATTVMPPGGTAVKLHEFLTWDPRDTMGTTEWMRYPENCWLMWVTEPMDALQASQYGPTSQPLSREVLYQSNQAGSELRASFWPPLFGSDHRGRLDITSTTGFIGEYRVCAVPPEVIIFGCLVRCAAAERRIAWGIREGAYLGDRGVDHHHHNHGIDPVSAGGGVGGGGGGQGAWGGYNVPGMEAGAGAGVGMGVGMGTGMDTGMGAGQPDQSAQHARNYHQPPWV